MQTVKVKRAELLEKITKNRDAHRELFLKAQEGYRKQVIHELDLMLEDARAGRNIRRSLSLPEPQDHTSDYDREISMLQMSVDDVIEVSMQEFDWYVMDNWSWKASVTASNMRYV
ncbi:MAG: hypothetical protein KGL39_02875 [Patescibacteria group bacterium]|nr:hypothetical protein [Patescibacteria group bacterium]